MFQIVSLKSIFNQSFAPKCELKNKLIFNFSTLHHIRKSEKPHF